MKTKAPIVVSESNYRIFEYFVNQHNLTLLESDIAEIVDLCRKEIVLPVDEEIEESIKHFNPAYKAIYISGARWMRDKVTNPYPKTL